MSKSIQYIEIERVLRGIVATHMRCGVIFDKYFAANLLENLSEKKF